jgi:acetyl-CoA acetyltransferase
MGGKIVIAGIGHTKFGALPGRSTISMNVEACRKALADAGVEKSAVDALYVKYPTSAYESKYGQSLAEAMGLHPRIGGVWDQAGASNASMIAFAAMAIEAGQCEVALVTGADNPKSGTRQAYARMRNGDGAASYGWFGVPPGYAMIARRHMEQYGTTHAQLGAIAVACRAHGAENPNAQLRKPITLGDYFNSRWIVDPLRRDDCCLVSDSGGAVLVMSAARAKALKVPAPVPILGYGQGQTSWEVALRPDMTSTEAVISGKTAFAMAGLTPKDIDVAQLYDCFTITPLMTLEDYGFCKKGEGGRFVEDGALHLDGALPTNTSGGLLSETGMPGMQLIIEGVRQMRGTANLQVKDAQKCLVSNQGGVMHTHSTLILGQ